MTCSKYILTAVIIVFVLLLPIDLAAYLYELKKPKSKMPSELYKELKVTWGGRLFSNILVFLFLGATFLGIGFLVGKTVSPWVAFMIALFYTGIIVGGYTRCLEKMEQCGYPPQIRKAWVVDNVDGVWHRVEYFFETKTEKHRLLVDKVPLALPEGRKFDIPVQTGSKECWLVRRGNYIDLAVDGMFMEQGTRYTPKEKRLSKILWQEMKY